MNLFNFSTTRNCPQGHRITASFLFHCGLFDFKPLCSDLMNGWITLHRQFLDHDFYFEEKFTRAGAWIDLLLLARFTDGIVRIRGIEIKLKRGDVAYSIVSLAKRWQWNSRTVARYLQNLVLRNQIHSITTNVTTIISIINFDKYQISAEQSTQQSAEQNTEQKPTRSRPECRQSNKGNKDNKGNEGDKARPRDLQEVIEYFTERGQPEPSKHAQLFYDSKDANGWKVGSSPIKDWRAAVRTWISRIPQYSQTNGNNRQPFDNRSDQTRRAGFQHDMSDVQRFAEVAATIEQRRRDRERERSGSDTE